VSIIKLICFSLGGILYTICLNYGLIAYISEYVTFADSVVQSILPKESQEKTIAYQTAHEISHENTPPCECDEQKLDDSSIENERIKKDVYVTNIYDISIEQGYLAVYKISGLRKRLIASTPHDLINNEQIVLIYKENLLTFNEGDDLVFRVDPYPFGCVYEQEDALSACIQELGQRMFEYQKVGGIWKFNVKNREFNHMVPIPKHDIYDREIKAYNRIKDTNFIYYSFEYYDQGGVYIEERYVVNVDTGEAVFLGEVTL